MRTWIALAALAFAACQLEPYATDPETGATWASKEACDVDLECPLSTGTVVIIICWPKDDRPECVIAH